MKIIEDLEMAANSDPHGHPSFSEDSRITDDGTCSVDRQTVNLELHINLDFFLPMKLLSQEMLLKY